MLRGSEGKGGGVKRGDREKTGVRGKGRESAEGDKEERGGSRDHIISYWNGG